MLMCKHRLVNLNYISQPTNGGSRISFGWRCQLQRRGQKAIIWPILSRKLHENERNWTERGRLSLAPPWICQCLPLVSLSMSILYRHGYGQALNFKNMTIWSHLRLSAPVSPFSHNGNLLCPSFPRCDLRKTVHKDVHRAIKVTSTQNWMCML